MKVFLDTNIIVYANDHGDPRRQHTALQRMAEMMTTAAGVVSTQVLAKFSAIALGKLRMSSELVVEQLRMMETLEIVQLTPPLIRRGIELRQLHRVHFWDGCILAAAEQAGCGTVLSEDLNPGQTYSGVKVENPFLSSSAE